MSDRDSFDFEDTMDVLEAAREKTEARFQRLLGELSEHVERVRAATELSTRIHRDQIAARRRAFADVKEGLLAAGAESGASSPWPSGGGRMRGTVNRLARWLLRDYLEVIDRRSDTHTSRIEAVKGRVDRLQELVASTADGEEAAAIAEALEAAQEALQAGVATHREMLDLINAKDAEVLQRAVAGPLRRMEVIFDEFGRQQEALLSQLVGRRQELDRLVRGADSAPKKV